MEIINKIEDNEANEFIQINSTDFINSVHNYVENNKADKVKITNIFPIIKKIIENNNLNYKQKTIITIKETLDILDDLLENKQLVNNKNNEIDIENSDYYNAIDNLLEQLNYYNSIDNLQIEIIEKNEYKTNEYDDGLEVQGIFNIEHKGNIQDLIWDLAGSNEFKIDKQTVEKVFIKEFENKTISELNSAYGKKVIERYKKYENLWERTFSNQKLPTNYSLIAYLESNIIHDAISNMGAVGYFQFIEQTGKSYGLTINEKIDERMEPAKSAIASSKYLKTLENQWINKHINYLIKQIKIHQSSLNEQQLDILKDKYSIDQNIINNIIKLYENGNEKDLGTIIDNKTFKIMQKDAQYLALCSYNGGLAHRMKNIQNYENYLDRIGEMIKVVKSSSNKLSNINKQLSGYNMEQIQNAENEITSLYKTISDRFFDDDFFNGTIEKFQKEFKRRKTIELKRSYLKGISGKYEGYDNYFEYWYYEILSQNLLYPAKLNGIINGYRKTSQLNITEKYRYNPVYINQLGIANNGISFIKICKGLGLEPEYLYSMNQHILNSTQDLGNDNKVRLNVPYGYNEKLHNLIANKEWKKYDNKSNFKINKRKLIKEKNAEIFDYDTPETINYSNPKGVGFKYLKNQGEYSIFSYVSNGKETAESIGKKFNKTSFIHQQIDHSKDIKDEKGNRVGIGSIPYGKIIHIYAKKKNK